MKPALLLLTGLLITQTLPAQELNIGIHFNPIVTVGFIDDKSTYDKQITTRSRLNYNVGANVNLKYKDLNLETGLNIVQNQRISGCIIRALRVVVISLCGSIAPLLNFLCCWE